MIGATFCSGIGAPEMAAPWVSWQFASEIEPFPRAVLADRFGYRDARRHLTGPRLWADMAALKVRHMRRLSIPFPDLIVAGTPCQSFSVTYRGKPASDGPQYKAYGNSMAVPVIRWIMDRIRISWEAGL